MKLTCVYCAEANECSCPDCETGGHADAKFVCPVCAELLEDGVPEAELKSSPRRAEVKHELRIEEIASAIAGVLLEGAFEPLWTEQKEEWRKLSKKELAEQSCHFGLFCMARALLETMTEEDASEMLAKLKTEAKEWSA